jgi:hypothetical protein
MASVTAPGFSVLVLASDCRGIEVGFWADQIWAQAGGAAEPPGGALFTRAEHTMVDTQRALVTYTLALQGDHYQLASSGAPIVRGPVRDYTAFVGPVNP